MERRGTHRTHNTGGEVGDGLLTPDPEYLMDIIVLALCFTVSTRTWKQKDPQLPLDILVEPFGNDQQENSSRPIT